MIGNDGARDLIVDGVELIDVTPESAAPFVVAPIAAGSVLRPGEPTVIDVRFAPLAAAGGAP